MRRGKISHKNTGSVSLVSEVFWTCWTSCWWEYCLLRKELLFVTCVVCMNFSVLLHLHILGIGDSESILMVGTPPKYLGGAEQEIWLWDLFFLNLWGDLIVWGDLHFHDGAGGWPICTLILKFENNSFLSWNSLFPSSRFIWEIPLVPQLSEWRQGNSLCFEDCIIERLEKSTC